MERLLTRTDKLDKARNQIRSLEEELARATEFMVLMSKMSQNTTSETKLVEPANLQKEAPETDAQPEASTALVKDTKWEQEMLTLREGLVPLEALREREREQKKTVEEERRQMEESLWKSQLICGKDIRPMTG